MSETTASALFYMLLSACLGFVVGWVCGEQVARHVNAKVQLEDLFERLEQASTQAQQLKEIRSLVNDAYTQILAVSKSLENPPH